MTRVEIRIRSLVVHGGAGFTRESFGAALQAELARRVAPGADPAALAARFSGAPTPQAGPEAAPAARLARRLLP